MNSTTTKETTLKDLTPLKVNNEWTYRQTTFDKGTSRSKETTVINKVIDSLNYMGQTWFLVREFGDEFYLRNSENGQHCAEFEKKDLIQTSLYLKHPNSVKTTPFEYSEIVKQNDLNENSNIPNIETNRINLVSKNIEIKIDNQIHHCHQYDISPIDIDTGEIENYKITIYIELGIGIIKHIIYDENEIVTSELINKKL
ncbi:hypothetical protein [uncultured Algibacter sp.]|uniref:hypothetical protein n=1 Tax=uncultured Algibacter sp. TaxID=298659 RepID=UPI00261052FA|nr:hypothetical protein [uncultured Algibacter sp.]